MSGVGKRIPSDLHPVEMGYFIGFGTEMEHSRSVCTLVHRSPFVAMSVVFVSVKNDLMVVNVNLVAVDSFS